MKINALLMKSSDCVATCVAEVPQGAPVVYHRDGEVITLVAVETIPIHHKVAVMDLAADTPVYKYGELIGKTTCAIPAGCWVSHNNIVSVPRDYESEFIHIGG